MLLCRIHYCLGRFRCLRLLSFWLLLLGILMFHSIFRLFGLRNILRYCSHLLLLVGVFLLLAQMRLCRCCLRLRPKFSIRGFRLIWQMLRLPIVRCLPLEFLPMCLLGLCQLGCSLWLLLFSRSRLVWRRLWLL